MRIGILTGGGDVPGLNPCIKAVVNRATDAGHEVMGIRRGWGGLLNFDIDNKEDQSEHVELLTKADVARSIAMGAPISTPRAPIRGRSGRA